MMKYFNWRYLVIFPLGLCAAIGVLMIIAGIFPGLLVAFIFGAPCICLWDKWIRSGELPSGDINDTWEEIDERN